MSLAQHMQKGFKQFFGHLIDQPTEAATQLQESLPETQEPPLSTPPEKEITDPFSPEGRLQAATMATNKLKKLRGA